jgi:hypothetical protein
VSPRLLTAALSAGLALGALTGCAGSPTFPAAGVVHAVQIPADMSVSKSSPPAVVVPTLPAIADRSQLTLIDSWALTPTAVLDDGKSVITQTAAVTAAAGALVLDAPGGTVIGVLPSRTLSADTVVPVVETRYDGAWLRVELPSRMNVPSTGLDTNGATGWVSSSEVAVATVGSSVVVDLTARTLTILDAAGTVTYSAEVGIGKTATPTPTGRGYLASIVDGTESTPRVFATSMHSAAIDEYAGDSAVIGAHTVAGAGMPRTGAVSNGCVRLSAATQDLVEALPPGTPLEITNNEGV